MRIVKREGQIKVIEFEEGKELIRRVLPAESDNADLGAPYGIPFAIVLKEHGVCDAMAKKIEQELHRRNIWTAEDLQNNHNAALSAI